MILSVISFFTSRHMTSQFSIFSIVKAPAPSDIYLLEIGQMSWKIKFYVWEHVPVPKIVPSYTCFPAKTKNLVRFIHCTLNNMKLNFVPPATFSQYTCVRGGN